MQLSVIASVHAGWRERRRVESLPLRQQVLTVEKLPAFLSRNTRNMPVFCIFSAKRTGESGLSGTEWRQSTGLSLEGTLAVRFL
jgi:hypothetical protein